MRYVKSGFHRGGRRKRRDVFASSSASAASSAVRTPLDALLGRVLRLRFARFLVQLLLLCATWFLFDKAFDRLGARYLVELPAIAWFLPVSLLGFLFFRSLQLQRRQTEKSVAGELDRKLGLKQRLGTYLELRGGDHPFLPALTAEAEKRTSVVRILPAARMGDRVAAPLALVALLLIALPVIPLLPVPAGVGKKLQERQEARRAAAQLEKAAEAATREPAASPELARLVEDFRKAAREMQKTQADRATALKELNRLDEKSQQASSRIASRRPPPAGPTVAPPASDGHSPGGEEVSSEETGTHAITPEEARELRKALEEYRAQKERDEARLAELQKGLEGARKQVGSEKHRATYDSKISERDMQKGKSSVDDGPGTTNQDVGPSTFDTSSKQGQYVEDRTKAEYEKLYKGEHVDAGKKPLYLPGEWDPDQAKFTRIRDFGAGSRVELKDIPLSKTAQDSAESVLSKEKIPASYQRLIKKYFDSIEE